MKQKPYQNLDVTMDIVRFQDGRIRLEFDVGPTAAQHVEEIMMAALKRLHETGGVLDYERLE